MWGTGGVLPVGNRLHFTYTGGPPSAADCLSIGNAVSAAVGSHLVSLLSSSYELFEVEVTDLSSSTGAQNTSTTAQVGTRAGAPGPASLCALMDHHILRRYRGGKPRTYLPFGVDGDITNERTWATAFATAMATGWSGFIAACLAITGGTTAIANFVQVSYFQSFTAVTDPITGRTKDKPKLRVGGPVVDVITSSTLRPELGSQRRRLNS